MRPEPGTYPAYFENYIPLIKGNNVISALERTREELVTVLYNIPPAKETYAYAPGKWTVKQVIQHVTDAERVFAYRALRFARGDEQQPLPFEENDYAKAAELDGRTVKDQLAEFETVRQATLSLFRSFSQNTLLLTGKTTFGRSTVLAVGYLIAGHGLHHLNVLKQRYL
jgi:hypothetical protein